MAVTFDLESIEGVAIGTVEGPLTLEDLKILGAEMWQLTKGPQIRILWDLRRAQFDLETAEVRDLAEFAQQVAPSDELRTAFLVSGDLEFGLVRMFEVFRESDSARTSVFRDKEQAVSWLENKGEPNEAG